jgi:hypothetical protein
VSAVVISLCFFFYFLGCQISPQIPETDDQEDQGPAVTLLQPEDGKVVSGKVTLVARVEDASRIEKVSFYLGGMLATDGVVAEPPYEYVWDTTTLPDSSVYAISVQVMTRTS